MIIRSRKPGQKIDHAGTPPAAGQAVTRKTRMSPDSQGGAKCCQPKKEDRKRPGRKPWIPDLEKIENWARQGLKDHEIAGLCGVRKETFSAKKNELNEQNEQESELANALARGRAKGTAMASSALWKNIVSGDQRAIEFYLERISGWKKTQVMEKRKSIEELTDEELLALLEIEEGKNGIIL